MSLGTDRRELAYQLRDELRTASPQYGAVFHGRSGALFAERGTWLSHEARSVRISTEAEARKAIQEMAARKVDRWIKIWHDAARENSPLLFIRR